MEPYGGPSIANMSFLVFEASNVPLKLETEKRYSKLYSREHFYLLYRKRQSLLFVMLNKH
jgi:hypothetical protein